MEKLLLLATSALLLLAGCAKEESGLNGLAGDVQTVTFTASMDNSAVTKAVADNDGNAASVNRCIMEIYYGDDLFSRMIQPVSDKKASFTTQLVANRTYTVAFWADCVTDANTDAGLATDFYYTTTSLKTIAINGTYVGNNDARDAFFHCGSYTVKQDGSAWTDIKLYRPFAQVNVITTDLQVIKPVPSLTPSGVDVTVKNAYTTFNVVSGDLGGATTLNYKASLYNFPTTIGTQTDATLSMDYIFAASEKAVIDIDWKATKANNADVSHAFTNIPYQRNYRTNIKGALLTTSGQWNVTVDPEWESSKEGKEEYNVYCTNVSKGADVKGAVSDKKGDTTKDGQGISVTIDQGLGTSIVNDDIIIPDNTPKDKTPEIILDFKTLAADAQIIIRDENHPRDAQEASSGAIEYTGEVVVIVPEGTTAEQVKILTDKSTVTVRGQYGTVIASCAPQTIVVSKGSVVCTLSVMKGNVDLYGQVTSIERAEGNTSDIAVNVYDGAVWGNWSTEKELSYIKPTVNLGTYTFDPTGYNVAGSTIFANTGSSPATWTVSVTDEWQYYAAESFSNIDETNKVITIMNAAELAKFAKDIATLGDYSVVLGTDIDLSAHNWNPIASFTKTFDGQNRTISGMTVNGSIHQGLFASLNDADVLDLTISGANVTSTITSGEDSSCGVLAGEVSSGSITNVKVRNSNITANGQYVGALFGIGYSEVDGCEVSGCNITGTEQVGAALGYMWVGYIQNCTVTGNTVHATSQRAGGLIGKVQFASGNMGSSTMWIKNNTISGTITAETANTVGGVAGQIMGDCDKYEISGNSIDAADTDCPIGTLRSSQSSAFTSVLAAKIHDNTWTEDTYSEDCYTYPASLTGAGDQIIWNGSTPDPVAKIGTTEYFTLDSAIKAAIANNDGVAVELIRDITYKPGASWTPIPFGQYVTPMTLVIDGKNFTITNLPGMLLKGGGGGWNLTVKDLTFEKPTATGEYSAAVICGYADVSNIVNFNNVTINKATVTSSGEDGEGGYAAAFIGYNASYDESGVVTFTSCAVTNSTITGFGSAGALMGHASGNTNNGKVVVTGTVITGNTISCTESGKKNKAGAVCGTVGSRDMWVNATVSGNTVTSDGTAITAIYGRQGDVGKVYLTEGGSYADKPIADADASWAMCDDGCVLKQVDNVWTVAKVDGVACVGGVYYKTLDEACAAVNADTPMTWVASSVWANDKVAYYGGTFYATLSAALDAANTANAEETALIYLRPAMTGIAVSQSQYGGHDQIKTSITIFGNDAHLASQWQPCVEYKSEQYDAGGHILTKDITYSIYNLHDGASAWGARGSTYTLNVIAKHCTNMSQVYVSVGTQNGPTNFTVEDCTFKYQPKGGDNRGYVCPITTNQQGAVTVKGCTFTDFDDNYVFNINNKMGGSITVNAENLTFDNCGSSSKQAFRLMGEAEGTTIDATLKNITFSNNSGKIADIVLGKKDAGENKCAVTYAISETAGTMQVYTQNTATETVINLDSAHNYSGDNK